MKRMKPFIFFTFFIINTSFVFSVCKIRNVVRGETGYVCDSLGDLMQEEVVNMTDLLINTNNLEWIASGNYFQNTLKLHTLEIEFSLRKLKSNTFVSLTDLTMLILKSNDLPKIQRGIFESLPVSYLSLHANGIQDIEENAFNNMLHLETLRITNNHLGKVKRGIFNGLQIEFLSLTNNKIYHIVEHAFYNMTKLKNLHLDRNMLQSFTPKLLLNHGSKLEILWLQENSLKDIDRNFVRGLYNLRILNLTANKISKISIYTFNKLKYLEVLMLSMNELEELDPDIFPTTGMHRMKMLYIDRNKLSYLNSKVMIRLNGLKNIRMYGNPWQCACLDLILRWFTDLQIMRRCDGDFINGSKPTCIVNHVNPTMCRYVNDPTAYRKYKELLDELPQGPQCFYR